MRIVLISVVAISLFSYGIHRVNSYYELKESLFDSVRKGNIDGIEDAIEKGMTLDTIDGAGQTPLHVAAYRGTPKIMKYLIDKGADIMAEDRRGGTPLHWASIKGDVDNAEILVNKGAEINARDKSGDTPLHWAVAGIGVIDVKKFVTVAYLLNKHADPNIKNFNGKTALDIAEGKGDEVMIRLLKPATK